MRVYEYGAKRPVDDAQHERVWQQLRLAHRYKNELTAIERDRRAARVACLEADDEAGAKAADEAANERVRAARSSCGVYWGTYLCVEDAVQRAKRSGSEPKFHRWEGGGHLAVQLQGGLSIDELLKGGDSRVRVVGEGRRRQLWLRVGSDGRQPIWAVFPFVYHRDLPPQAILKWVRVHVRRVGTKSAWTAQFVIDNDGAVLPPPTGGTVAIDVGWRKLADGMRVAVWKDDAGRSGELRLPARLLERWQKVADLRSIRDKNFNAAIGFLRAQRAEGLFPDWLKEETTHAHAWKAQGRLAALMIRWRQQRFAGDDAVFAHLEGWRKQDKHLLEWEANQRENVLRSRREHYRLFALQVARYQRVVVEKLDLRDFAELPGEDEPKDDYATAAARPRRFVAALSELLHCAADAVKRAGGEWVKAPPEWTTKRCSECGNVNDFDAATSVMQVCSACGREWDQDVNAAENLLRAATSSPPAPDRSQAKVVDSVGESPAQERRRRGLETRRTKRSKTKAQVSGLTTE